MQAGATIPAILVLPLAGAEGGWRFSAGSWTLLSAAAAVPWIVSLVIVYRHPSTTADSTRNAKAAAADGRLGLGQLLRYPIAIGTALLYATASLNT